MDRTNIFKRINTVFNNVLEDNIEIKESYTHYDVDGWDSLTHIMLIVEIEKEFNLKFTSSEMITWQNIGEMIDCIEKKLN